MGDNADEKRVENVPRLQQSRPIISIRPQIRQKVLLKIINTLRGRCKQPGDLAGVEIIARKFEGKILAIASDEEDYLRRIAYKMKTLDGNSERSVNTSPAISASGGPNQLHSALSGNVQSENVKYDQKTVQSQNPAQPQPQPEPQPHQIVSSNC
ncbi:hypothetical protein RND81_10G100200 [Saponaria officinalis]|uniref:Mediator complex subunit 15 KIX domain-containing protein n=1 Tax=Saponaria officinalis TaxID=3572 RepID=A0AAW1I2S6_SAPOF